MTISSSTMKMQERKFVPVLLRQVTLTSRPPQSDSLADIDDMDDLMLPDDVDEVSTKLDLARAFHRYG